MNFENAVVLVPGFFGFGRLGDFYYFADRVSATARGAAEVMFNGPTPVMGVATVPAGSLAERQRFLLKKLTEVDKNLEGPKRFHLVGHSAGGVDAELLRTKEPLDANLWSDIDPNNVRARLATITTISSPHYGTYLADSDVAGFLRAPLSHLGGLRETVGLAAQLALLAIERPVVHEALIAGFRGWSDSARFLISLLTDEKLLSDLRPEAMEKLRRERPPFLDVPVTCFVTAVPSKPVVAEGLERKPDAFFDWLRELTGKGPADPTANVKANISAVNTFNGPVARNPRAELPLFDATTNDGIVNSAKQILRTDNARLGGIVLADHGDVIGHYDRQDPLTSGTPINDGVFRSGAGFGDDQFFQLYGLVANAFRALPAKAP